MNSPIGYLHKYTSDGETLIWERFFYKFLDRDNYIHDMILTSDGGILVSGYILSAPNTANDAWLVKFDSCGFTVGDVPVPNFIVDSINKSQENNMVYLTDQSFNYCTGELDWGDGSAPEAFYAYENNLPLADKNFSHSYTENGTYTIRTTILAGDRFMTREQDIEITGVNSVISSQAGISLFPNPANDFVVIENKQSIASSFQMNVYTTKGKQVKIFNLNPILYQQKVNVSSLNNGVYFVRFEVDGVLIGTEKLVLAR